MFAWLVSMTLINFDIVALVTDVIELLEVKARKKNIRLNLAREYEKPLFVRADKERIRQVLINLLDNSIKYGTDGGKTKVSFFDMDETS